ncbi:SCP-like extracellular [Methylobacterium sp. 4-46]|uniref:CAP domain-containing protein n=1 Tax=unclassified Methylobacterium TaxID=2615210 RepID=UPI000165C750|nr:MULTISPECIES: CAP domain-containing protein [Methylobacterium]ACA17469.1 SCP-like extracellular [Methylobacterium sp. 4-46]WFT83154.1 CAP domain-containing protein [Methylobacterium nodulans]
MRPALPPLRFAALAGLALALASCAGNEVARQTPPGPSLYWPMTSASAQLDLDTARDMIGAYRRNKGLPALALDPGLQRLAETESAAMAAADRPSQTDIVRTVAARMGFAAPQANLSAGYHTLAEAFSGWRDSPAHNAVLLSPEATRMGIATAYAPGSKYKVYWTLLVAK